MHRDSFLCNSISIQQSSESIQAPGQWGALWATPSCDSRCTDRGRTRPNHNNMSTGVSSSSVKPAPSNLKADLWIHFVFPCKPGTQESARRFWNTVATQQTWETTMQTFCSNPSLNPWIQNKRNSTDPTNWSQVLSVHSIDWYRIESWPKELISNRIVT